MAANTKLHTPPKSQAVPDINPRGKSFVLHAICAAIMINGFLAMTQLKFGEFVAPQYGGFWQFLTVNGLFASVATLILSAASDLLPAVPTIRSVKRAFLLAAMPVEVVVSTIYWPLVLLAPHLMLPPKDASAIASTGGEPSSDPTQAFFYIPLWMDLSMHALPAAILLFDFMFLEKKYTPPTSTILAPLIAGTCGTAYATWVEHCAKMNSGRFPYPFLTVMDLTGRVTMYVCSTLLALGVFWGLNRVHR